MLEAAPAVAAAPRDAGRQRLTAQEVVDRWNAAHNAHDARALESLYAPRVAFYATTQTSEDCAAKKAAAFAKSPDFAQTLRKVAFNPDDPAEQAKVGTLITFQKTSTIAGKSVEVPASIGVAPDGLITFESDGPTNDKLGHAWFEARTWCLDKPGWTSSDRIIAPYKISAKEAMASMLRSKFWAELRAEDDAMVPDTFFECPISCDQSSRDRCGYAMR